MSENEKRIDTDDVETSAEEIADVMAETPEQPKGRNKKYQFVDDPEPQARPEDLEDKIIRHGGRIFNTVISVVGGAMLILFIYGIILRLT